MSDKCTQFAGLLSGYADGELGAEETAGVSRHLEACPDCTTQVSNIRALKLRLRQAGETVQPAIGLETRIRARLREQKPETVGWFTVPRLAGAALGVVALTIGAWVFAIQPMQKQIAAILGIGTADHVHCALERKDVGTFTADTEGEMPGLFAAVKDNMPTGFNALESHVCRFHKRHFGHMVFEKDGHRLSVIVTRKQDGESFPRATILASMRAHGIPVYLSVTEPRHLQTAGLDSGRFFAFVVSDLSESANRQMMARLGPAIADAMR